MINKPLKFEVYVEMSEGADPIKYEVKKHHFFVKRILVTSLKYPTNYGYIPNTLAADGDELDALIITPYPLQPRARIKCRTIGALDVEDQEGMDYKLIAIPTTKVYPGYAHWESPNDLPSNKRLMIEEFFANYKQNDTKRWSKVNGWLSQKEAEMILKDSYDRYNRKEKV